MKRRYLLAGILATAAVSAVRAAERDKVFRLALVATSTSVGEMTETGNNPNYVPFFKELRRLGYVEGNNLTVLRFSAAGDTARYDSMVREIAAVTPDAIIVSGNRLVLGLKAVTNTIPVIALVSDPIASGIVSSLSRPGGNITGVTTDAGLEISGKRLAILLEVVPGASRVGFLVTDYVWETAEGAVMRDAAERTSVSVVGSRLSGAMLEAEYRRVFESMKQDQAQAMLVSAAPENYTQRRLIVDLADKARLPAIYPYRDYVALGGLMAYSVDIADLYRRAAGYADLIFKGANPGEMPIYQATKFEHVINLRTAKAMGLTIPPTLLARADEVIE
jgi:putative ABC transport system substrate-binding protein